MAEKMGQLVLAGDPHQLGPVVITKGAKYFGYDKSMMQRLMAYEFYGRCKKGKFNEKYIIQLVKNYRSVPQLLTVPNKLFYGHRLVAQMKPSIDMISPSIFGNSKSPLIYYSVTTKHAKYVSAISNFVKLFVRFSIDPMFCTQVPICLLFN